MTHQGFQDNTKDPQDQETKMSFPVIAPFSYLPMVKLLSIKGWLQRYFLDMHKRQQPSEIVSQKLVKSRVIHPSQTVQISLPNVFLHGASNSDNSRVPSIVLFDHIHKGPNCRFCWGFQLNIHRHVGKGLEYLLQSGHFFVVAANSVTLPCEIQSNLFFEGRQFLIIEITDML